MGLTFGLCKIESFQKSFNSVIMASQNVNPTVSSGMLDKDAADRSSATSSAQVSKRLQQELMSLMMSNDKGISAFPDGDKLFEWIATVNGPLIQSTMVSSTNYASSFRRLILIRHPQSNLLHRASIPTLTSTAIFALIFSRKNGQHSTKLGQFYYPSNLF